MFLIFRFIVIIVVIENFFVAGLNLRHSSRSHEIPPVKDEASQTSSQTSRRKLIETEAENSNGECKCTW